MSRRKRHTKVAAERLRRRFPLPGCLQHLGEQRARPPDSPRERELVVETNSKHGAGSLTQFTHVQSKGEKEGPVQGTQGQKWCFYCHPFQ